MGAVSAGELVAPAWREGRCPNEFYCELASEAATIRIAPGARFICPNCGKNLIPVRTSVPPRRLRFVPVVLLIAGLAAAGLVFQAGLRRQVTPAAPPVRVAKPAPAAKLVIDSVPMRLLAPARPITVIADLVAPAPAAISSFARAETPPRKAAPRAKPAQKTKQRPPTVAVLPRGFSTQPVSGGFPPFPDNAPAGTLSSVVHVSCMIGLDGKPSDCQVGGEAAFRRAVQSWLGTVRFAPPMRDGVPTAMRETWDVQFDSDSGE